MAQFDLKKATIKFKDGGSNSLTIKVADGTMDYVEHHPRKYIKDRGNLSSVLDGDQEPVDVTLDIIWEFLKQGAGEAATPEDCLKQRGGASGWVSSDGDACNPYAIIIEITFAPGCSPTQNEKMTLTDFRHETLNHDLKGGMIKVSGKCNITEAAVVRF